MAVEVLVLALCIALASHSMLALLSPVLLRRKLYELLPILKNTSEICLQTSVFGTSWLGHRSLNIDVKTSKSVIFRFSWDTFAVGGCGSNLLAMSLSDVSCLSVMVFKIIFMSAVAAGLQMHDSASLYELMNVS